MSVPPSQDESLFSYGTLQLLQVQLATFGRALAGRPDEMPGFELSMKEIGDAAVVKKSGKTHHPIAGFTGRADDRVKGVVFQITARELEHADKYEVAAYRRVSVTLASGLRAWVYVDAQRAPPG
jgi:hypothetical protein